MSIESSHADSLRRAVALLSAGELVAFPTETVYGLGADAANPAAVARIFAAKGRPANHPVIVHVASAEAMTEWAQNIPDAAWRLARHYWPGPLTLILQRAPGVPDAVTGGQTTVGLRCPDHPVALALLRAFRASGGSGGLAAPSANRYGRVSPTTAAHVAAEFGAAVPLVLDGGPCAVGIESTILDLSRGHPVLLRPGHIGARDLQAVLGAPVWLPDGRLALATASEAAGVAGQGPAAATTPRVSGSLSAHYAPLTPMALVPTHDLPAAVQAVARQGGAVGVWSRSRVAATDATVVWRQAPPDPVSYARELYATLRELDQHGLARLLIEAPPQDAEWLGVRDRLGRAVVGSGIA